MRDDDFMPYTGEMHPRHRALPTQLANAWQDGQGFGRNEGFAVEAGRELSLAPDENPMLGRHDQVIQRAIRPECRCADQDRCRFFRPLIQHLDMSAGPQHRLHTIVECLDRITYTQRLHRSWPRRCVNAGVFSKADRLIGGRGVPIRSPERVRAGRAAAIGPIPPFQIEPRRPDKLDQFAGPGFCAFEDNSALTRTNIITADDGCVFQRAITAIAGPA